MRVLPDSEPTFAFYTLDGNPRCETRITASQVLFRRVLKRHVIVFGNVLQRSPQNGQAPQRWGKPPRNRQEKRLKIYLVFSRLRKA